MKPKDYVTLGLSDSDFRDLVAESLKTEIIYEGPCDIVVEDIATLTDDNRDGWHVTFSLVEPDDG